MTQSDQVKAALAALANGDGAERDTGTDESPRKRTMSELASERADYRRVIDRASAATDDIEAAAEFVESTGLDRLHEAVERAEREVSGLATDGRQALEAFERYRLAAKASEQRPADRP